MANFQGGMMTIDDAASKCGGKAEDLTPSLLFKVE
jgi:hypothetical protein